MDRVKKTVGPAEEKGILREGIRTDSRGQEMKPVSLNRKGDERSQRCCLIELSPRHPTTDESSRQRRSARGSEEVVKSPAKEKLSSTPDSLSREGNWGTPGTGLAGGLLPQGKCVVRAHLK